MTKFQLQFNRRPAGSPPDWVPMPEGRGVLCSTREECRQLRRDYQRQARRVFGAVPDISLRIVEVAEPPLSPDAVAGMDSTMGVL